MFDRSVCFYCIAVSRCQSDGCPSIFSHERCERHLARFAWWNRQSRANRDNGIEHGYRCTQEIPIPVHRGWILHCPAAANESRTISLTADMPDAVARNRVPTPDRLVDG